MNPILWLSFPRLRLLLWITISSYIALAGRLNTIFHLFLLRSIAVFLFIAAISQEAALCISSSVHTVFSLMMGIISTEPSLRRSFFIAIVAAASMAFSSLAYSVVVASSSYYFLVVLVKLIISSWGRSSHTWGSLNIIDVFLKGVCYFGLMVALSLVLFVICNIINFRFWLMRVLGSFSWSRLVLRIVLRARRRSLGLIAKWRSLIHVIVNLSFSLIWSKLFQISNTGLKSLDALLLPIVSTGLSLHGRVAHVPHRLVKVAEVAGLSGSCDPWYVRSWVFWKIHS